MSFGGFLKNLVRFVPLILGFVPKAQPYNELITAAVTLAEETGLPGKDKKKIARDTIIATVRTINAINPSSLNESKALEVYDENVDRLIAGIKTIPNTDTFVAASNKPITNEASTETFKNKPELKIEEHKK